MSSVFRWSDIIGHEEPIGMLKRMLQNGNIQHALLFTGPDGVGKSTVARHLAAAILCEDRHRGEACGVCSACVTLSRGAHPDLYTISPEGTSIKIEQIRVMQREMAMSPCQSQYRVCIIETAEHMTDQAANSLLKVLEEPPAYLVFILTSNQRHRLLDTIVSRCRLFPFQPVLPAIIADTLVHKGINDDTAQAAARLSGGRIGTALKLAEPDGLEVRNSALSLLERLAGANPSAMDIAAGIYEQDDKQVLNLLRNLAMLLRDLLVLHTSQSEQLIFNADIIGQLTALSRHWSDEALIRSYGEIRQAERALASNANTRLTAEALLIHLTELYKGGTSCCRQ